MSETDRDPGFFERAFESASVALLICDPWDPNLQTVDCNEAFLRLSDKRKDAIVGEPPWFLQSMGLDGYDAAHLRRTLARERRVVRVFPLHRPDGTRSVIELTLTPLRSRDGVITHVVASHVDVTRWAPSTRGLDGRQEVIPGISIMEQLRQRLSQALAQAKRHDRLTAVLMIELDRYDRLSSSLGHRSIDELVRMVAMRLVRRLRDDDIVARAGEGKLAIVLADMASPVDVADVAQRTLDTFSEAFEVSGTEVFTTASIGATAYPMDGDDADTLLRGAEIALHRAKDRGGNTCHFFTLSLQRRLFRRMEIETGLRRALSHGELSVFYQPKVSLSTGELTGMEALVRWNRPGAGLVSPVEFIPVAEETDLIVPLGEWVIRHACQQASRWWQNGIRPRGLSVNVSARHFRNANLLPSIVDALAIAGLPAELLEIELTESTLMSTDGDPIRCLADLRAMGVRLAIDDFGTGYSSLAYLKRLPIDTLKIDRDFLKGIDQTKADREIVRAIIEMAHALGLSAVAEGVERVEQLQILRELECDEMQGFLIAKPAPAQAMTELLREASDESFTRRVTEPCRVAVAPRSDDPASAEADEDDAACA